MAQSCDWQPLSTWLLRLNMRLPGSPPNHEHLMRTPEIDVEQASVKGYVYVLKAKDMFLPLCKIGRTSRNPFDRCAEINRGSTTGDFLWEVEHQIAVSDCHTLESMVHTDLQAQRQRGREFFNIPPDQAMATIRSVLEQLAPQVREIADAAGLGHGPNATKRKARTQAQYLRPARDIAYAHLLDNFNHVLKIKGRLFGQLNKPHFGISDGREGVQWNLAVTPKEDSARLGVNLEGKIYRGWPIAKLIQAELHDPQLLRVVPELSDPQNITLQFTRDAWQAGSRLVIVEELLGGGVHRLSELTAEQWRTTLTEALGCLDTEKNHLGRAKQAVTLKGAQQDAVPRTVSVSPHLTIWTQIDPSSDSEEDLRAAFKRLKPLHEWALKASGDSSLATSSMKLYKSVEAANNGAVMNTIKAATKAGLTKQVVDDGHILCSKPDTMELVNIFPDGSWEYQNVKTDGKMQTMSGANASLLALYLHSDENKAIFEAERGD